MNRICLPIINIGLKNKSIYGPELVINGNFDSDTIWNKSAGWEIAGGEAVATATALDIIQTGILTIGELYRVYWEMSEYTAGSVRAKLGGPGGVGVSQTETGVFEEFITAVGTYFSFDGVAAYTGKITSVSIKKVL